MALISWSVLFLLCTFAAPHTTNATSRLSAEAAPEAAAGPEVPGGCRPQLGRAPHRRSGLAQGSSSTSAWEFLSLQKFCFSNVKCITATLNPGLSPMSHDITVPTWPVKTLALSREIYGYETKWGVL